MHALAPRLYSSVAVSDDLGAPVVDGVRLGLVGPRAALGLRAAHLRLLGGRGRGVGAWTQRRRLNAFGFSWFRVCVETPPTERYEPDAKHMWKCFSKVEVFVFGFTYIVFTEAADSIRQFYLWLVSFSKTRQTWTEKTGKDFYFLKLQVSLPSHPNILFSLELV